MPEGQKPMDFATYLTKRPQSRTLLFSLSVRPGIAGQSSQLFDGAV